MKNSIIAQQIAQTYLVRQEIKGMYDEEEVRRAILRFLDGGEDAEDRAEAFRLALGRANRRMEIEDIVDVAQRILDWPPKPKLVSTPKVQVVSMKSKKKATKKKTGLGRRK